MKLINRTDTKQRILWFSDIHFLEDSIEGYLQGFLDQFFNTLKELNREQKIDYVIISGDLTNKGKIIEFEKFEKSILIPLFNVLKDSKLFVIPGNHDLDIENGAFNLEKFSPTSSIIQDEDYMKFFKNYSDFCSRNISYFPDNIEALQAQNFLYGYHKDENKKLLFILLNSAWLSLSVNLLEHFLKKEYVEYFDIEINKISRSYNSIYTQFFKIKKTLANNNLDELKKNISKLNTLLKEIKATQEAKNKKLTENAYDISYQTIEYGTQELFLNLLFDSVQELKVFLDEHKSYFILSVMHHSENHLTWNERMGENSLFKYLKEKSDIVLSSHEHVPIDFHQVHNVNETLHLKSGPFIELKFIKNKEKQPIKGQFDYYNKDNLKKSTFSILDINITKKGVKESKYVYKIKKNIEVGNWIKLDVPKSNSSFMIPRDKIMLCNNLHIKGIYERVKNFDDLTLLKRIINPDSEIIEVTKEMYSFENNLVILVKKSNFQDIDKKILKEKIIENRYKKVFFYAIDFMIDSDKNNYNISKIYKNKNQEQVLAIAGLKNKIFKNFNKYRADFFNTLIPDDSKKLEKVSFILILLPYWEIERILPP